MDDELSTRFKTVSFELSSSGLQLGARPVMNGHDEESKTDKTFFRWGNNASSPPQAKEQHYFTAFTLRAYDVDQPSPKDNWPCSSVNPG
ncbi:hypothetical protein VTK26DRAFT_8256 [Humicola hyalothermophila]